MSKRRILSILAVTALVGCGGSSKTNDQVVRKTAATMSAMKTDGIRLSAPQYVMVSVSGHFSLNVPSGVSILGAQWSFGDGTPSVLGAGPIDHQFWNAGQVTVNVSLTDSLGTDITFSQVVNVLPFNETLYCISGLSIVAPSEAAAGSPVAMSVNLPGCLEPIVTSIQWVYGDNTPNGSTANVTHTYTTGGEYHVAAIVNWTSGTQSGTFALTTVINVSSPPPPPPPTGDCPTMGVTKQITLEDYSEEKKCGINGMQTNMYHDVLTLTCKQVGETLHWTETSRVKQLVSEGACKGQACALPEGAMTGVSAIAQGMIQVNGNYYIPDGGQMTFYTSQTPAGSCSEASQIRHCSNGTLDGSTDYHFLLCRNGCPGLGPDGTMLTDVRTGQITSPHTCPFGEAGINDIYSQLSDQSCQNGTVVTSNTHQGGVITAGVCPTYKWAPTEMWSACSAACGGEQTQAFRCADNTGATADAARCEGIPPVVTRVCDGDPESVRRSESATSDDEDGSTRACPANQIGIIDRHRTKTTTTAYACINHAISVAAETVSYGDWVEENYCRDFVAFRCSADSLNNTEAHGRYEWMKKCANVVPIIKEFLVNFEKVNGNIDGQNFKLGEAGRVLYPTFMYRKTECKKSTCKKAHDHSKEDAPNCTTREATWPAPTTPDASCEINRPGLYVAAVCVSSCATPEQQILSYERANSPMAYAPFIDAWAKKFDFVATMHENGSMQSRKMQKTKVDQWVTEVIDTDHDILEFHMKSGGSLRLTPNHPLLGVDAIMRQASEFKAGDSLVLLGGKADPILRIDKVNYFGKVYNVFVKSSNPQKNVVVTNGYLNGTAFYQNEGGQYLNKKVLRTRLTRGVFKP